MPSTPDNADHPGQRRLLTTQEALIVKQLLPEGGAAGGRAWRYGEELARATGLPTGTIHPILARLVGWGWLEDEWRKGQHDYRLTEGGAVEAQAALARLEAAGGPGGGRAGPDGGDAGDD
jgi:PadR family transcriptional regulator, regulatory protein PadR